MATITKGQAVDRLTQAVRVAHPDDLAEIHNELFPEKPTTEDKAKVDPSTLVADQQRTEIPRMPMAEPADRCRSRW